MNTTTAPIVTGWSFDAETRELTVGDVVCTSCQYNRPEVGPGRRQVYGWTACTACKGKGTRGRGKCRACEYHRADYTRGGMVGEYAPGMVPLLGVPIDGGECPACLGTQVTDSYRGAFGNARIPGDILSQVIEAIPVQVFLATRPLSHGEQLVGPALREESADELFEGAMSCSDYGTKWGEMLAASVNGQGAEWTEAFRLSLLPSIAESMRRVVEVAKRRDGTHYTDRNPVHILAARIVVLLRPNGYTVHRVWNRQELAPLAG